MPYFGPIIPPDSPLALPDKNRRRKRIALFGGFAVMIFGLVAVALQGCNGPTGRGLEQARGTNALPVFETPPNFPVAIEANAAPVAQPVVAKPKPSHPVLTTGRPYKIARGDNFDSIAKKFHIPVKALEDANPGLEPKKLQIDQVIQIPVVSPQAPSSQAGALTSQ